MADVGTPSAMEMNTQKAGAEAPKAAGKSAPVARPERPDEEQYKKDLTQAEKELKASQERMSAIKAKLDNARPNNKDSPSGKRQQELRAELQQIRTQQQSTKSSRGQVLDKIKRLDENLKARIAEQKTARSKTQFKNADEVQSEIDRLQKQVDSGMMKLVDEKKALSDITMLNKQKKGFAGFDQAQKGIDDVKAQISELRKSMDDPESKALSDRYTAIQKELDDIRNEQDGAFKNLNALRDERTRAHEDQQKKYTAVKEIKDKYFQSRRAAMDYEREAKRIRDQKRKEENDAYHRGRRQEAARSRLEEASAPAYQDEIRSTQTVLAHFDPSYAPKQDAPTANKLAAAPSRTVDDSGMKGTKLVSKKTDDEEAYFIGGAGKKNKKGRKQTNGAGGPTAAPAKEGRFSLDRGTIETLGAIGVDPPMQQSDIPAVVEKLKEKLEFWKNDQKRKTDENIAKAQADIDKLEAEASEQINTNSKSDNRATETDKKPAAEKQQTNGQADAGAEGQQEQDVTKDVTEEMEKTKLEDDKAPEGGA